MDEKNRKKSGESTRTAEQTPKKTLRGEMFEKNLEAANGPKNVENGLMQGLMSGAGVSGSARLQRGMQAQRPGGVQREELLQMLARRQADKKQKRVQGEQGNGNPQPFMGTGLATEDPVRAERRMPVDKNRIREARQILMDYKAAKWATDQRIIEAQQWWRQKNWEQIVKERGTEGCQEKKSSSGLLKSSIIGKHADYIQSYPEPLFLARNEEDEEEAQVLSEIVPVVLKQIGFENVYDSVGWQKLVEGLGVYSVTWDGRALHGLGNICIKKINTLNLYTEPGIEDIQESANIFCVRMESNGKLAAQYPQLKGKLGQNSFKPEEYREKEETGKADKSTVIDWYYKKWIDGRETLQYCRFVADEILYATENEPDAVQGLYQHGQYPFVTDTYLPVAGTIYAQGMVDLAKDTQIDIDTMGQAMTLNATCNATPRYFMRQDGAVNESEFLDWGKPIVHVNSNLGNDSIQKLDVPRMDGNTLNFYTTKVEELKSITGNTEVSNGEVPSGVTSGVAIAALKEDAGKTSKDSNKASYRAMEKIYLMVVELIRQFYTLERQFRIIGEDGMRKYIRYNNERMQMVTQMDGFGGITYRMPTFDVDVHVQRENAYTRMAVNELAMQFYGMGIFNPMAAPQALSMLQMMDFTGKEKLVKILQQQFMMTMTQMSGQDQAGQTEQQKKQQGNTGTEARAMPVEDDATESGVESSDAGSTPATRRMQQRVNEATRP